MSEYYRRQETAKAKGHEAWNRLCSALRVEVTSRNHANPNQLVIVNETGEFSVRRVEEARDVALQAKLRLDLTPPVVSYHYLMWCGNLAASSPDCSLALWVDAQDDPCFKLASGEVMIDQAARWLISGIDYWSNQLRDKAMADIVWNRCAPYYGLDPDV